MWKIVLFGLGSVGLLAVSRRSLLAPRSHGFPRFFAWEAILALVVLHLGHWFRRPFAPTQLVSWALLLASLPYLWYGLRMLAPAGGADDRGGTDDANFAFENTTRLVETGIYRYVRHPLYASLLVLAWGVFFKGPSVPGALLALVATGCLVATAVVEERENVRTFGEQYTGYMRRTRRFIPFVA